MFCGMNVADFLNECDAFCQKHDRSRARLSTILFGSGATLDRLHSGASVTVRVFDRAVQRLREEERRRGSGGNDAAVTPEAVAA